MPEIIPLSYPQDLARIPYCSDAPFPYYISILHNSCWMNEYLREVKSHQYTQHHSRNETFAGVLFRAAVNRCWMRNLHCSHHTCGNTEAFPSSHCRYLRPMIAQTKKHLLAGEVQSASQLPAFAICLLHVAKAFDYQTGEGSCDEVRITPAQSCSQDRCLFWALL